MGLARAYLLESESGLGLVDAGSPGKEQIVLRAMQDLSRKDLKIIFITHAHLDHYGSANALRRITGARIAIHTSDADSMAKGETRLGVARGRGRLVKAFFPLLKSILRTEPTSADLLLEDGDPLKIAGQTATVIHTPGHTPGSCSLLIEGGAVFCGDLISTNGHPHVQRSYATDWALIPKSLARLGALQPEVIYPGHGTQAMGSQALYRLMNTKLS